MLVLTRKVGEAIIIKLPNGQQVDVIVTDIGGSQVRIAVDADRCVEIMREELIE